MYNDNREYEPNQSQSNNRTMSSFIITKAKVVNTKNGERLVLESGNDDLKIWMPSTHKDAAKLVAGVTVEYETTEKGFHNYKSILASAPPTTAQAPQQPARDPVTLTQLVETWTAVYDHMHDRYSESLNGDELVRATTTVFIQACQVNAYKPKE